MKSWLTPAAGLVLASLMFSPIVALAADSSGVCATPAEIERVRADLQGKAPGPLGSVAKRLGISENRVASALPAAQSYGVAASHFQAVWKSIEQWDDAVTLITRGADVFEISGRVGSGKPSERSKFFNLTREGPGLGGHLRPDLYSAIYVLSIPGKGGGLRGVSFLSAEGEAVFGVYVPGEGQEASESVVRQFEATRALIRSLPALCPQ
jgi:putative heme utilization carrier protein HutX